MATRLQRAALVLPTNAITEDETVIYTCPADAQSAIISTGSIVNITTGPGAVQTIDFAVSYGTGSTDALYFLRNFSIAVGAAATGLLVATRQVLLPGDRLRGRADNADAVNAIFGIIELTSP